MGRERLGDAGVERATRRAGHARSPTDAAWVGEERHRARIQRRRASASRPRTELAEAAGLDVDDGILTDAAPRDEPPADMGGRRRGARRGPADRALARRPRGRRARGAVDARPAGRRHRAPWVFSEIAGSLARRGRLRHRVGRGALGAAPRSVLAYLAGDRVVQLAVIGSALDPVEWRARLVGGRDARYASWSAPRRRLAFDRSAPLEDHSRSEHRPNRSGFATLHPSEERWPFRIPP